VQAITMMGWAVIGCAAIAGLCFLAYLMFLRFVIVRTGCTEGLSDVAKAIAAYKVPLPSRHVGPVTPPPDKLSS
jgi:hypothetical protein